MTNKLTEHISGILNRFYSEMREVDKKKNIDGLPNVDKIKIRQNYAKGLEQLLEARCQEAESRAVEKKLKYGDDIFQLNLGSALRGLKRILKQGKLLEGDLENIDDMVTYLGMYEDEALSQVSSETKTE